jgi:ABC-type branched-subunit amino acid transport system substrate-binding protein
MHNHNKPMRGLLLFFITLVGFAVADVSSGTINLGMSLTTTPADSALAQEGNHILHGLQYWLETIDSTSKPIRGSTFRFELKILEDDGSIEKIISNYQRLLNDTQVDYLIGPVDADANIFVSELTNSSGRLLLAPTSVETGYYLQKKLSFSVLASALSCLRVTFPFFRLHGDRKVALLVSESSELKEGCERLTDKEVSYGNIILYF